MLLQIGSDRSRRRFIGHFEQLVSGQLQYRCSEQLPIVIPRATRGLHSRLSAHDRQLVSVTVKPAQKLHQPIHISWRHGKSAIGHDDFWADACFRSDRRQATSHRLEQGQSKAVRIRWEHEHVGLSIAIAQRLGRARLMPRGKDRRLVSNSRSRCGLYTQEMQSVTLNSSPSAGKNSQ